MLMRCPLRLLVLFLMLILCNISAVMLPLHKSDANANVSAVNHPFHDSDGNALSLRLSALFISLMLMQMPRG